VTHTSQQFNQQHHEFAEDVRGAVGEEDFIPPHEEEASCYESVLQKGDSQVEGDDDQPPLFYGGGGRVTKYGESEPGVEREGTGNGEDIVVEAGEGEVVGEGMLHSYSQ